jgi:hypothetical protein
VAVDTTAGEGDHPSQRRPAHAPRHREAGRASQARGRRAAAELSAARQARRHHGGALHACASVQARPAPTQIPAHAARPHQ